MKIRWTRCATYTHITSKHKIQDFRRASIFGGNVNKCFLLTIQHTFTFWFFCCFFFVSSSNFSIYRRFLYNEILLEAICLCRFSFFALFHSASSFQSQQTVASFVFFIYQWFGQIQSVQNSTRLVWKLNL